MMSCFFKILMLNLCNNKYKAFKQVPGYHAVESQVLYKYAYLTTA